MGSSRQEYWGRLQPLPLGNLPDSGIKPASLVSPALAGGFFTISTTWEAPKFFADMPNYPKQLYKKKESCSTYSPLQDSTLDDNQDSTVLLKGLTDEAEPIAHK